MSLSFHFTINEVCATYWMPQDKTLKSSWGMNHFVRWHKTTIYGSRSMRLRSSLHVEMSFLLQQFYLHNDMSDALFCLLLCLSLPFSPLSSPSEYPGSCLWKWSAQSLCSPASTPPIFHLCTTSKARPRMRRETTSVLLQPFFLKFPRHLWLCATVQKTRTNGCTSSSFWWASAPCCPGTSSQRRSTTGFTSLATALNTMSGQASVWVAGWWRMAKYLHASDMWQCDDHVTDDWTKCPFIFCRNPLWDVKRNLHTMNRDIKITMIVICSPLAWLCILLFRSIELFSFFPSLFPYTGLLWKLHSNCFNGTFSAMPGSQLFSC